MPRTPVLPHRVPSQSGSTQFTRRGERELRLPPLSYGANLTSYVAVLLHAMPRKAILSAPLAIGNEIFRSAVAGCGNVAGMAIPVFSFAPSP